MSIFGKINGAKVSLAPRVKHNGVVKTPVSGWTKQNGVLKKIWSSYAPSAADVKCDIYAQAVTCGAPYSTCIVYLRRDGVLPVPVTYELTYGPRVYDPVYYADGSWKRESVILEADTDYSAVFAENKTLMDTNGEANFAAQYISRNGEGGGTILCDGFGDRGIFEQTAIKAYYDGKLIWQDMVTQESTSVPDRQSAYKFGTVGA